MKNLLLFLSLLSFTHLSFSQNDSIPVQDTNTYRFIKTDGGELFGKILNQDEREILILTSDNRRIYIPQHVIRKKVVVSASSVNEKGKFIGEDQFSTRYFLTTNGLPIRKGEHYVQLSTFGAEIQFGLGKNFGVGIMTSWLGTPLIGTIKKSWKLGEKTQVAVGGLIGTGSWVFPKYAGALPYATLSFGDRSKNLAISGGYGVISLDSKPEGRAITSIAGMIKVSSKLSLVFDSFILLPGQTQTISSTYDEYVYNSSTGQYQYETVVTSSQYRKPGFALLMPGLRWHHAEGRAFQFGFAGLIRKGKTQSFPIPMIQWFRSI